MLDIIAIAYIVSVFYKAERTVPFQKTADNTYAYISADTCRSLRGLFALMVALHHLAQGTQGGFLFRQFEYLGLWPVRVFFFISGYGLLKQLSENEHYLDHFIKKRIVTLLLPWGIVTLIYWAAEALLGTVYTAKDVLFSFFNGSPIVGVSWYIIVSILFYAVFYFSARISDKKPYCILLSIVASCFAWILFCCCFHYGLYWYRSVFAFAMGVSWAFYEDRLLPFLQRRFNLIYPLILVFTILCSFAALYVPAHYLSIAFSEVCNYSLVIVTFLTSAVIRLNSPILKFYGGISMELYLIHVLCFHLCEALPFFQKYEGAKVLVVVLASTLSAILLHRLFTFLRKKLL